MNGSTAGIAAYLGSSAYRAAHPRAPGGSREYRPFVTISRQTGAGGHTLARVLAQAMRQGDDPLFQGWQVFDRELCETLMRDPKLRVSIQSLLTEAYRSQIEDAIFSLLGGETPRDVVVRKLFETIRALAAIGRVIIVGRAGMCVTRGLPDGVHLRLVAPEPVRIARMRERLHVGEHAAREMIGAQDHDRARLVRDHCHRDIDDPLLYDATWNTQTVPFEAIAASLIALIRHRADAPPAPAGQARGVPAGA